MFLLRARAAPRVVTVRDADVDDWSFRDGKKRVGGETVTILETRRRLAEVAAAEKSCLADSDACYKLAKMYRDGEVGDPLPVVAFRLFDTSCRGGSSQACNTAGWTELRGEGTSTDPVAAGAYFAKACPTGKEDRFSCDSRGFALVTGLARTILGLGCDNNSEPGSPGTGGFRASVLGSRGEDVNVIRKIRYGSPPPGVFPCR